MTKCNLAKEINQCPFFDKETGMCGSDAAGCGMREEVIPQSIKAEKRDGRWYEPFMHGTRRMKS